MEAFLFHILYTTSNKAIPLQFTHAARYFCVLGQLFYALGILLHLNISLISSYIFFLSISSPCYIFSFCCYSTHSLLINFFFLEESQCPCLSYTFLCFLQVNLLSPPHLVPLQNDMSTIIVLPYLLSVNLHPSSYSIQYLTGRSF